MEEKYYSGYFRNTSLMFSELAGDHDSLVKILEIQQILINALENKKNIFWCGNGGSASDAEHLAAELVGRFEKNRVPLNSIALTTNSSTLTALSNDFGFEHIFERQIEALGKSGDVLISISTSGESVNVINGILKANSIGITTVSFLGKNGGDALKISDNAIVVKSDKTSHIQEAHIAIGQALCGQIEKHFAQRN